MRHTRVFTDTVKLLNSAFCISKTTKWISTKFIYFLPYIYTISHIKIKKIASVFLRYLFLKSARFSSYFSSYSSHKILQIMSLISVPNLKEIKTWEGFLRLKYIIFKSQKTFPCFDFFQIWNTYKAH